jgi:hypothetical protein
MDAHRAKKTLLKAFYRRWAVTWIREAEARVVPVELLVAQDLLALGRIGENMGEFGVS